MTYPAVAVGVALLAVATTARGQTPSPPNDQPVVIATGEAIVKRAPDRAWVSIAAESRARTPAGGAAGERRRDDGGAGEVEGVGPAGRRDPDELATTCSRSSTTPTAGRRCGICRAQLDRGARRRPPEARRHPRRRRRRGGDVGQRRPVRFEGPERRGARGACSAPSRTRARGPRRRRRCGHEGRPRRADRGAARSASRRRRAR